MERAYQKVDLGGGHEVEIRVESNGTVHISNPRDVYITYRYRNGQHGEPEFIHDKSPAEQAVVIGVTQQNRGMDIVLFDEFHIPRDQGSPALSYVHRPDSTTLGTILEVMGIPSDQEAPGVTLFATTLPPAPKGF